MSEHPASDPSRREFAAALALLAVAPLAAGADDEPAKDAVAVTAEALAKVARARYGSFLTAEQMTAVEKSIRGAVLRGELMRKMPLKNGDEPAFAFSADVP